MGEIGIAFELLGVGMITVFVILALVVILGNLIIRAINRYMPEIQKVSAKVADTAITGINPKKMAVIASAVNKVTNGTGRATKIEKL